MFLQVSVIIFTGGGIPACLAGHRGGGEWCIPACLAGFQAHTQGELEGSGQGGLQAHTGGVSRPTRGGSPGPHWGGL